LRHLSLILTFKIANKKPVNTVIRSFSFGYLKHIIRMTKSKTMRWARNVSHGGNGFSWLRIWTSSGLVEASGSIKYVSGVTDNHELLEDSPAFSSLVCSSVNYSAGILVIDCLTGTILLIQIPKLRTEKNT
jgi:hypothetical protein